MSDSQFVRWWRDNPEKAEVIRENRRQRLQTDASAIDAHRQRCKEYYERTKQTSDKKRGANKPKVFWINERAISYVGVGQLVEILGLKRPTFRKWEDAGVFPAESRLSDAVKRRWWPLGFVQAVLPIVREYQEGQIPSLYSLALRVNNSWQQFKNSEGLHEYHRSQQHDHRHPDGKAVGGH